MTLCKTCGQKPSERTHACVVPAPGGYELRTHKCHDPIHFAADAASELVEALTTIRSEIATYHSKPFFYTIRDGGDVDWTGILAQADAALLLARGKPTPGGG